MGKSAGPVPAGSTQTFFDLASPELAAEVRYVLAEATEIRSLKRRLMTNPNSSDLRDSLSAVEIAYAAHVENLLARAEFRQMPADARDALEAACLI